METGFNRSRVRGFTIVDLVITVAVAGLLAAIAVPSYKEFVRRAQISAAIGDLGRIQLAINNYLLVGHGPLPESLATIGMDTLTDPWGNPYQYLNIEAGINLAAVRKNRNLVPLNTDFDLYSMGSDGASRPPLTARVSRDDIVRANNGAYFGLAEDY